MVVQKWKVFLKMMCDMCSNIVNVTPHTFALYATLLGRENDSKLPERICCCMPTLFALYGVQIPFIFFGTLSPKIVQYYTVILALVNQIYV